MATLVWQGLDYYGNYTPYYFPAGSPGTTSFMSNLVVFPPKGNEPTFDERLADLKASAGPTPIVSPDAKNKVAKAGPTEAENKEQHPQNFKVAPAYGLSHAQHLQWKKLSIDLYKEKEPCELDPDRKRARKGLCRLQRLAELAGDRTARGTKWSDRTMWYQSRVL